MSCPFLLSTKILFNDFQRIIKSIFINKFYHYKGKLFELTLPVSGTKLPIDLRGNLAV